MFLYLPRDMSSTVLFFECLPSETRFSYNSTTRITQTLCTSKCIPATKGKHE